MFSVNRIARKGLNYGIMGAAVGHLAHPGRGNSFILYSAHRVSRHQDMYINGRMDSLVSEATELHTKY